MKFNKILLSYNLFLIVDKNKRLCISVKYQEFNKIINLDFLSISTSQKLWSNN